METISAKALKILERENAIPYKITPFMNHLVIEVNENNGDFASLFKKVEKDVKACLEQNFQDQYDNILFEVKYRDTQKSFKVYK